MGGQITLEGRKRPTGGSSQLLSPRSKAHISHIRLSETPKAQSTPIVLASPLSPTAVQSINVRLHTLRKYRVRPSLTHRSLIPSPMESLPIHTAVHTEGDTLDGLPTARAERRTYKLQRKVKFFEELDSSGEPQMTLRRAIPNSARRESLSAAVEYTRAASSIHRTSILSLEPLRIPGPKKRPQPLQLTSVPESPAVPTSWGSLLRQ